MRNFYKWFGDSKVVDEQGRPMVVYHGTKDKFESFNKNRKRTDLDGFFFSTKQRKEKVADWYAGEDGKVMSVYLSLKNPKIGTPRSREMLKKMDEWESSEFAKRYDVSLQGGYYVIKDKRGKDVYDKRFDTEQEAREYGKNELFARGFEQYLRTGKAPPETGESTAVSV